MTSLKPAAELAAARQPYPNKSAEGGKPRYRLVSEACLLTRALQGDYFGKSATLPVASGRT